MTTQVTCQPATGPVQVSPASTDPSAITNSGICSAPAILTSSGPSAGQCDGKPTPIRNTYQEFISMHKQANNFARGGAVNLATGGIASCGMICWGTCGYYAGNTSFTPVNEKPVVPPSDSIVHLSPTCTGMQVAEALPYVGEFISAFTGCTQVQGLHCSQYHDGPLGVLCGHSVCYINGTAGYGGVKNLSTTPYWACAAGGQPGQDWEKITGCTMKEGNCYGSVTPGWQGQFQCIATLYPEYGSCGSKVTGYSMCNNGQTGQQYGLTKACSLGVYNQCTGQLNCGILQLYPEYNKYYCVGGFDKQGTACWIPPWEGGNSYCPWIMPHAAVAGSHFNFTQCGYIPGNYNNYAQLGQIGCVKNMTGATLGSTVLSPPTNDPGAGPATGTGSVPSTPTCGTASAAGVPVTTPGANTQALTNAMQNANNPVLPNGTQDNVQLLKNTACQELNSGAYAVNTGQVNPQTGGTAQTVGAPGNLSANTYQAAQTCPAFTIKPAQGQVDQCALVSNQLQKLTCFQNGTPGWAQPAINSANSLMAARGLGSSTIAGGAFINAVESAALPVAQANAQYFANLDTQNLSNQQQAIVTSAQLNAQALLSNTAATNAAAQFNASSANQTEQFMANLSSQIQLTNAAQVNAMQQFNAGQLNSVDEFNANMANNVSQFNAANRLAIDQSNVTWRRNINTLNTAAVNAANQVNSQNLFNLSSTAQNDLWQQLQDQASWANTDAQNGLTRAQNMAIASLGVQTAFQLQNQASQAALMQYLGGFGLNIAGSAANSLFSTLNSPPPTNSCNPAQEAQGCITSHQVDIQNVLNGGTAGSSCCPFA